MRFPNHLFRHLNSHLWPRRGVYGVEVDYREKMLLMRRLGQRDVWSELGLWSKAGQGER